MYLHLGQNTVVDTEQLLGVFDLDNSTVSKHTRDFLARAEGGPGGKRLHGAAQILCGVPE